jgi:hypothetical protein
MVAAAIIAAATEIVLSIVALPAVDCAKPDIFLAPRTLELFEIAVNGR